MGLNLWWWGLILIGISILVTLGERRLNLARLPKLSAKPVNEIDGNFFVEVENDGGIGHIRAELQVMESNDLIPLHLNRYNVCWVRASDSISAEILHNDFDRIHVAKLVSYPPNYISQQLYICYYDPTTQKERQEAMSAHWIGATVTSQDGTTKPLEPKYYLLRLKFIARERLRGDTLKNYRLSVRGLEEI